MSNTWNYKNQMTQAVVGAVTTTYAYDHTGQRVKYANGTTTTIYPSKNYNLEGSTQMKHIFAGDMMVATVKGTGASAAVFTAHTDHLSGSNVITNSGGTQEELMDYFPFGEIRLDQKAGSFNEQRKFSGHEYDTDTGLNYMNARYYKSDLGRFVSQDPIYLLVGDSNFSKKWNSNWRREKSQLEKAKQDQMDEQTLAMYELLSNPQNLNSYSYVVNNPLKYTDPTGEWYQFAIGGLLGAVGGVATQYVSDVVGNYQAGKTGSEALASTSSSKEYAVRSVQGGTVGLAAATGNLYLLGGTALGTSVVADKALGNNVSWTGAVADAAITVGTAGVLGSFPGVPGRLPASITSPAFWTGKHTQNEVIKEAISQGVNLIKETGTAVVDSVKNLQLGL